MSEQPPKPENEAEKKPDAPEVAGSTEAMPPKSDAENEADEEAKTKNKDALKKIPPTLDGHIGVENIANSKKEAHREPKKERISWYERLQRWGRKAKLGGKILGTGFLAALIRGAMEAWKNVPDGPSGGGGSGGKKSGGHGGGGGGHH